MITRTQPAEVFTTEDGSVFLSAEEAHTHEREERLFALARGYASKNKTFSLTSALSALAVEVHQIVRATPLAKSELRKPEVLPSLPVVSGIAWNVPFKP